IQANPAFHAAWFNMACAYSLLGEKDNMLNSLKKAIDLNPRYKMTLQQIPDFQRYRNDPEFLKLSGR
ncbi:MAG: prenyltransferase, partial [Candidatus Scalindua sp.]